MTEHGALSANDLMMGRDMIIVHCPVCGWDNDAELVIVDRWMTDYPPIPRGNGLSFLEIYRDDEMDPDDRLHECPSCGEGFDPIEVLTEMNQAPDIF